MLPWLWYPVRLISSWTDILAVAMPLICVLAVLGALGIARTRRSRRVLAVAGVWLVFTLVAIVGPWRPVSSPPLATDAAGVQVVSVNSSSPHNLIDAGDLAAAVDAQEGDVAVVTELSRPMHRSLVDSFPHHLRNNAVFTEEVTTSIGVYSRHPLTLLDAPGLARTVALRVRVDAPEPFVLYASHFPATRLQDMPDDNGGTPGTQRRVAVAMLESIGAETLPVVLAGDLNVSDRSAPYRLLNGELRDAMAVRWTGPTSRRPSVGWPLLALRIDHVFTSTDWCAADSGRFTAPSSDHVGVWATVGPCVDR